MSQISFSNLNFPTLASSVSGGPQVQSGRNESAKAQSQQDFRQSLDALTSKQTDDVGETDLDADRDADGRMLDHGSSHDSSAESEQAEKTQAQPRQAAGDPNQLLGRFLDLDA